MLLASDARPVPKLRRKKATRIQGVWRGTDDLAEDVERCRRRLVSKTKDEPAGSMLPLPLQFLAAWLAVWLVFRLGVWPKGRPESWS